MVQLSLVPVKFMTHRLEITSLTGKGPRQNKNVGSKLQKYNNLVLNKAWLLKMQHKESKPSVKAILTVVASYISTL